MTKVALVGDHRIGMVAVVPAQIDSMHGNPATFPTGSAGTSKEHDPVMGLCDDASESAGFASEDCERLPDGGYNIVLLARETEQVSSP